MPPSGQPWWRRHDPEESVARWLRRRICHIETQLSQFPAGLDCGCCLCYGRSMTTRANDNALKSRNSINLLAVVLFIVGVGLFFPDAPYLTILGVVSILISISLIVVVWFRARRR